MTNSSQPCDQESQAVRYYKTDVQGVTYTELRRVLRGWIPFLIMSAVKLLGMHKRLGWGIPHPRDFVLLEPKQLPPRAAKALAPAVAEWADQGLHPAFYWTLTPGALGDVQLAAAATLSDDGTVVGTTLYVRVSTWGHAREQTFSGAASKMPDGVVLSTTSRSPDYQEMPHRRVQFLVGRPIAAIVAHHRYRLRNISLEPVRFTPSTLLEHLREEQRRQVDAFIERGVLVPMSAEEVEAERRRLGGSRTEPSTPQAAPGADSGNPYQSPAASGPSASSPGTSDRRPIPPAWPLAALWLLWPPIVMFLSVFVGGDLRPSVFFLLIVLASNAGFVESMYRRRLVRGGWTLGALWALILVGQIVAAGLAVIAAMELQWIVVRLLVT